MIAISLLSAFRANLIAPFGLTDPDEFEYWFFIPNRDSGALSVLIAFWFLWNRRESLAASASIRVEWMHWISAAVLLTSFSWALWVSAEALLIPVLCLTVAALSSAWGGRTALRLMVMPCAALMLAFPPPAPIQAEIVWQLQNWTASGAHFVLSTAGYAPQLEGTELRLGSHVFVIIEACSGWRGIQVLSIVALAASELRALPLRRTLLVALAAIPLGIGLNILRACLVMLTQEELRAEFFESHTPQGLAVLFIGGVVLYALAVRLDGDPTSTRPESRRIDSRANLFASPELSRWLGHAATVALVFAGTSVLIPSLRELPQPSDRMRAGFPLVVKGWTGRKIPLNFFFPYSTSANPQFHAEYRKPDSRGGEKLVDLFIAWETPKPSGLDRMPDAKLLLPANDWILDSRESAKVWQFEIDAERAIVSRAEHSKFSHVIAWRIRDRGLFHESLLSLLGLRGCGASPHGCPRVVVRIAVPIFKHNAFGRDVARETAKEFIDDLIFPLKLLAVR
ncbi:MAG: exosortase/archaeosortase family protein [Myxococcota bacterium]